jgi:hypothetical protein
VTKSFSVMVGTSATPLVAPDWVNITALAATAETGSFSVTAAMLGVMVPYNSASAGTATIPENLTPVIGASVLLGQVGAGAVTATAGSGVTIAGTSPSTRGPNHVIQAVQTAINVWTVSTYSWNLPQYLGNPNDQPLLVAYGEITFTNGSTSPMLVDTSPEVAWGGTGTPIAAGESFTQYYGNGPAELWYGVVETTPAVLGVRTGAPYGRG